jgi:hypothetical protein
MGNVELNSDQKSVIWRYMDTWGRWRRLPNGHRRFEDLQEDMAQGYGMLLCGIFGRGSGEHRHYRRRQGPQVLRRDFSATMTTRCLI